MTTPAWPHPPLAAAIENFQRKSNQTLKAASSQSSLPIHDRDIVNRPATAPDTRTACPRTRAGVPFDPASRVHPGAQISYKSTSYEPVVDNLLDIHDDTRPHSFANSMRMLLQVPGESGEEDKARPTSLQQPQIAAINHRQRDEIEAYCRTQSAHSFQNFNWDTSSIPASNKSWRSSDGSYADGESALFEPLDIPGFPLPPPMIPTPMHIGLASPPPTIPCPPLPADYFGPGKVYGNNYFPHHRAVTSHNGAGTASRPPATALADYITSQPRISLHKNGVARDGDAQYAGLEVATRNMEPLPQNTVPTKPHTQPLSARRHSTSSLATSTVSSRFCYHPEMQRLPSPPCTPSLSARKTEPFAVAQPKFKTTDLDFDPGLAISKETFISCVDQQKNGSSDRCIEEYQMLPLFPIPQNDFQAPNKSSNRKMALHNKQLALHSTNPLDDGSLQQTEMTNNPTRYLDFEYGLRSDARSSSRYSSEEIQPATAQTTHENEFAKARSDAAGSSGPFSDILHCRDGPDEDLRGDRMLPHSTWRIRNWSHFSWNTPRDALELPSTDEKEAGGHKIKSTSPTSSQGAFCRKHDQRAQQQPSSTYRDILRRNRVAWGISGGVSVLLITLLLLMLLIVYPSIIQKSLNKAQFTLIDLNLQDPNIDSFILSLDLNLNNNGEFEGELLPMEANLGAYIPRYDNQNTTISRRKLFPEDYAVNTIQRRNKLAADYGGFLHKLKMPQIVFGGTAARLVKLPKTRVDNVNTGTNWGGVLAKAFHRDHVALDLKGDGYFRKGGLKAKVALDRSIDLVGLNDPTRLVTRSNSGLLNWTLVTDPSTKYTTLYGQSQFPNPTNVSMFMGNLTFDFRHREISIGKLLVRDYNLHPGLNGAVQFSASLRYGAFDYETMSGFLTTLMTWNPQWGDGFPYDYKFQVVGESAVIDHVEIPWLSQAVRGIKDNVYVLANQPWGYGDVSKITTRPQINRLGLRFSDIKPSIGSSVLQGRATKGRMVLSVILPVNMVDFSLDVQSVTHEISFVDPSTNFTYAKIDVIDPENTFTRTEPVKDLVEGYQRAKTRKLMLVGLENTRLTIFNGDIFGQLMLKPTLANEEISVLVRTDSVLKVLTPLGLGEIRNITHEAEIKMSGMGINRKDGPLEIKNTKVVSGQAGSPGESPSLELTADLHISSLGDMELEFGDTDCHIHYNDTFMGTMKIHNFTLAPGSNIFHTFVKLYPSQVKENEAYFDIPLLNGLMDGQRTRIDLTPKINPLGGFLLETIDKSRNKTSGFEAEMQLTGYQFINSIELLLEQGTRPTGVVINLHNPFHTTLALTYMDINIAIALPKQVGEVDMYRHIATISSQNIPRQEIQPYNENTAQKITISGIEVDPRVASYLTKADVTGGAMTIRVQGKLGIELGGFRAMVPYNTIGVKAVGGPEAGPLKINILGS